MAEYEKKLLNWLKSNFKSRKELALKYPSLAKNLYEKFPDLYNLALPSIINTYKTTFEQIQLISLKFNSRSEWKTKSPSTYTRACKNGWLEELSKHMTGGRRIRNSIDYNFCKKQALKYKSRSEWCKKHTSSYNKAHKQKWLDELTKHMRIINGVATKIKNLDTNEVFNSQAEARRKYKLSGGNLQMCLKGKRKTTGGYRWAYCDENGKILKSTGE